MRRKRIIAGVLAATAIGGIALAVPTSAASRSTTVPPVCLRVPLPDGLQLQVGYCPS